MLILTRKRGERIVIPQCNLVITLLAAYGNKVRLGLTAPRRLSILREEVWEQEGLGSIPKDHHAGCNSLKEVTKPR